MKGYYLVLRAENSGFDPNFIGESLKPTCNMIKLLRHIFSAIIYISGSFPYGYFLGQEPKTELQRHLGTESACFKDISTSNFFFLN